MKKIFFYILLLPFVATAQPVNKPVYLICTSVENLEFFEEFTVNRTVLSQDYYSKYSSGIITDKYPPIFFDIGTTGGHITLCHRNSNLTELARYRSLRDIQPLPGKQFKDEEMEIIEKPVSFLKEIDCIDLDLFLKSKPTDEQLWELGDTFNNKYNDNKVYLIDRNDERDGTIKLIEVKYILSNKTQPRLIVPTRDTVIVTIVPPQ